jgi:hypothetical protein
MLTVRDPHVLRVSFRFCGEGYNKGIPWNFSAWPICERYGVCLGDSGRQECDTNLLAAPDV